jgi:hypothetical protein
VDIVDGAAGAATLAGDTGALATKVFGPAPTMAAAAVSTGDGRFTRLGAIASVETPSSRLADQLCPPVASLLTALAEIWTGAPGPVDFGEMSCQGSE